MHDQHLSVLQLSAWSLPITTTQTEGVLLIIFQSGVEKWPVIEPTTLDLGSQSVACDHSTSASMQGLKIIEYR